MNSQVSSPTTVGDCMEIINPISIIVPKVEFDGLHDEEIIQALKLLSLIMRNTKILKIFMMHF